MSLPLPSADHRHPDAKSGTAVCLQGLTAVQPSLPDATRFAALRGILLETLRLAEQVADCPHRFRIEVRRPMVRALLGPSERHQIRLAKGLVIEVGFDSRIEEALLLSSQAEPDHVWEPQTTKLLLALAKGAAHVIVGGAYIGDQVIFLAQSLASQLPHGIVHAFEPMKSAHARLLRNVQLNQFANVVVQQCGLWDINTNLQLVGPPALASASPVTGDALPTEVVPAVSLDCYIAAQALDSVGLVMLDLEGGEEHALAGAQELLGRPWPQAPHLVFEVHRDYVDWSQGLENTSLVRHLMACGYRLWAIRDYQDNQPMGNIPVEVIPIDQVYLAGPPHGFNLLASKEHDLVERLQLRVVTHVSPKLLHGKDPALHQPLSR